MPRNMHQPLIISHWDLPDGGPLGSRVGVLTRYRWRCYVRKHAATIPQGVIKLTRCHYAIVARVLPTSSWMMFRTRREAEDGWCRLCRRGMAVEFRGHVDGLFSGNLVSLQWPIARCMMGALSLRQLKEIAGNKARAVFARSDWNFIVLTATGLSQLASAVDRRDRLGGVNVAINGEFGSVCTRKIDLAASLASPLGALVASRSALARLKAGAIWLHPDLFDASKTNMADLFVVRIVSMCKRFWKRTQNYPVYAEEGLAALLDIDLEAPHATVSALLKMVPSPQGAVGKLKSVDEWPRGLSGMRTGKQVNDFNRAALARVYAEIAILGGLSGGEFHRLLQELVPRVIPSFGEDAPKYRERSAALIRRAEYMWKARIQMAGSIQYQATCASHANGLPIDCGKGPTCPGCVLARTAIKEN